MDGRDNPADGTANDAEPADVATALGTLDGEGRIDLCGVLTLDGFARYALRPD